jgi:hypothetical protein
MIFLLAVLLRLTLVFVLKTYSSVPNVEPDHVAKTLARAGFFGNPFGVPTGPTAILAPGWPFLLALIYGFVKTEVAAEVAKRILSTVLCSAQYALLPALANSLRLPIACGYLAGAIGALFPLFFWVETNGSWESPCIASMLVGMLILSARLFTAHPPSLYLYGAGWGIVFLFTPAFASIFVAVLTIWWWYSRNLLSILKVAAIAGLVVSPWIIRNYSQLGALFFIRDSYGLELYMSNNPRAQALFEENLQYFDEHPNDNGTQALRLRAMGEVAYFNERRDKAIVWMRSNPGRFARLTAERALYFWFPRFKRPASTVLAIIVSVLAFGGLAALLRGKHRPAAQLFVAIWIAYPLPYYLIQVDPRYRYPLYSSSLLLAAVWAYPWLRRVAARTGIAWPTPH